ncbi:hypothetical protein [Streptomyces albofaciens]|uniref:hypothetical protein n=1 Tax=Streptomyces albofaciens TaxID=66866 RepID=UPI001FCB53C2|nr:hypothetical protein [Streptomyces albofaciens]
MGRGLLGVRLRLPVRLRLRLCLPVRLRLTGHLLPRYLLSAVRLALRRLPLRRLRLRRLPLHRLPLRRLPLNLLRPRRRLLVGAPRLPPGLARGRRGLPAGDPRITVRGQHNALSRGPARGIVRVVALSALRHRDSYELLTYGSVGSRYRVALAFDHVPWSPPVRGAERGAGRAVTARPAGRTRRPARRPALPRLRRAASPLRG